MQLAKEVVETAYSVRTEDQQQQQMGNVTGARSNSAKTLQKAVAEELQKRAAFCLAVVSCAWAQVG